jgi:hypothetical protein
MNNIFKSKKVILIIIAIVVIGLCLVFYFAWPFFPLKIQEEEEAVQSTIPETMKAGEVGEIEEGSTLAEVNPGAVANPVRPPDSPMPVAVFDTKGEIVSIGKDIVTVIGSGENFEDQKARDLKVKFTDQTITFEKGQQVKYLGLEGLDHLEIGQKILISSSENIRGKTEFFAIYINKI